MTEQELLRALIATNPETFTHKAFASLNPGTTYQHNWHIRAIWHHLELVLKGKIKRLCVCLPPRSLKSHIISVAFPAWVLGHDPTQRIICGSYSQKLGIDLHNQFRKLVEEPWYRDAFPAMQLGSKNSETELFTTQRGSRIVTSTDGSITGRGGDIIIVDDPMKADDAFSEARRQSVNQWATNTLFTRLDDPANGAIIVTMQRLHDEDLVGQLLRAEGWTVLTLPAIAEEEQQVLVDENTYHIRPVGDVLHPKRLPRDELDRIRGDIGPAFFTAQYQQRPLPAGGVIVMREWLRYYDTLPPLSDGIVFQSWDTANKDGGTNDYSVCTTWLLHQGRFYLLDLFRGRLKYPDLRDRAIALARRYDVSSVRVEDAGVGIGLIEELIRAGFSAVAIKPDRDKVSRMSVQSLKFQANRVYFPKHAPYLAELIFELCGFPNVKHDDQVDSICHALSYETGTYNLEALVDGLESLYGSLIPNFSNMRYIS